MKKGLLIFLLILWTLPVQARILLDVPSRESPSSPIVKGYPDVPENHWAREAIDELVEAGILDPGIGRPFWGEDPVDKYRLMFFLAKILERLFLEESGELPLADASLGYRDVNPINPAYRSIQQLIALGVLPPGYRQEVFNGNALVNRYQLVYFLFTPLEKIFSSSLIFSEAEPSDGYYDVPQNNFAYPTIQKLISLGVLPGKGYFEGEKPATRYWMAFLSVKILKQLYFKIKELEFIPPTTPQPFLKTFSSTGLSLNFSQSDTPENYLTSFNGSQGINLTFSQSLTEKLSFNLTFGNQLLFGKTSQSKLLKVNEAYLSLAGSPISLQVGRSFYYSGLSPFGASLLFDINAEAAALNLSTPIFNFNSLWSKFPSFTSLLLDLDLWSFIKISAGGNLISDPLDPSGTMLLPTQIAQTYFGTKLTVQNLEFTAEKSNLDFSNQDILPLIGISDNTDTSAWQYSLTYNSPEYGYSFSLGYQHVGEDFYNGGIADPSGAIGSYPGYDAFSIKNWFKIDDHQTLTSDLGIIFQNGANIENNLRLSYSRSLTQPIYLSLGLNGVVNPQDLSRFTSFGLSAGLSFSF